MLNKELIFETTPELLPLKESMQAALACLLATAKCGGKILLCGNGGSCSDCEHIAGELMKGFLKKRPLCEEDCQRFAAAFGEEGLALARGLQDGIPCMVLSAHTALMTALLNDNDPAYCFAQSAWVAAKPEDAFIGISTSGNSKNVLAAARAAKLRGAKIVVFTGEKESKLSAIADVALRVPAAETYRVQEYHIQVYHWLCAAVEDALYEA